MKEENKKEELQSRRDFFRKAAKTALPIIGAIALASTPIVSKATETAMGCTNYCSQSCHFSCEGACRNSCTNTCSGTCYNTCYHRCTGGCAKQAYA